MTDLHITAEHDGTVGTTDVRGALTDLDVSQSSPVDSEGRQLGTSVETEPGEDGEDDTHLIHVVSSGREGTWTKQSTGAVADAVRDIEGVVSSSVAVEGGYSTDSDE